jgi:hypothetical protein
MTAQQMHKILTMQISCRQAMDVKEQRRKKDRDRHARMTDEEKQEKLKKIAVKPISKTKQNKEANKRNMTSKESIAMVNPAYIATQQEGGTSTLKCETKKSCDAGRTTNIATSSKRRVLGKTEEN